MRKKIVHASVFFCLLAMVFSYDVTYAQSEVKRDEVQAVVLMDVSVRNLDIVEVSDKAVKIKFDFVNKGASVPSFFYGLELRSDNNVVADFESNKAAIGLSPKETKSIEMTYTFPAIPSGTYSLTLRASTASGVPVASRFVSNIEVPKQAIFGINPESCVLRVLGEPTGKTYTTNEGVDILPTEKLIASCEVINNLSKSVTLTPVLETFLRNRFGVKIDQKALTDKGFTLSPGARKTVSVEIDTPQKGQAYDTLVSFTDGQGLRSNDVAFHYVVRGVSATIQSLSLDKNSYVSGDKAQVTVRWSASADSFPESRFGTGTPLQAAIAVVHITSKDASCAPISRHLLNTSNKAISVDIKSECKNPVVEVFIRDGAQTLATSKYVAMASLEEKSFSQNTNIQIIVVILGCIVVFALMYVLKRKKSSVVVMLFSAFGSLGISSQAHAVSTSWTDKGNVEHHATLDVTKDVYAQGELVQMDVNFDSQYQYCTNGGKRDVYVGYLVKDSSGNVVTAGEPSKSGGLIDLGVFSPGAYSIRAIFGASYALKIPDQWEEQACRVKRMNQECLAQAAHDADELECLEFVDEICRIPIHWSLSDVGSYGVLELGFSVSAGTEPPSVVDPPIVINPPSVDNPQVVVDPPSEEICQDSIADNFGSVGMCVYSLCLDTLANNYNGNLPCTYNPVVSALVCEDSSANNVGSSLPCTYDVSVDPNVNVGGDGSGGNGGGGGSGGSCSGGQVSVGGTCVTPGFTLSVTPSTAKIRSIAGYSGAIEKPIQLSVNPLYFGVPVSIEISSIPSDIQAEFSFNGGNFSSNKVSPFTLNSGGLEYLPVSIRFLNKLPSGVYPITFKATGGGITETATVNLDSKPLYPGYKEI